MQNSGHKKVAGSRKEEKATSTTVGATSAPSALQKAGLLAFQNFQQDFVADLTASDEEISDVESLGSDQVDAEFVETASKVLFGETEGHPDLRAVDPQTLEALLEAAGIGNISKLNPFNPKAFSDTETISKLTSMTSMSSALEEAEAELYRIRAEAASTSIANQVSAGGQVPMVTANQPDTMVAGRLMDDGKVLQDPSEESESLLSLACSGGYYELAQVLLKINANVEDRGSKRDCTPLMEAASAGHKEIVKLLLDHMADVNAQSSAGNTPLMYACSSGQVEIVKLLLDHGANIEDHNENGHTPLMEAASSGYVEIAKILLERGAGINTHSTEFKESALTLACYKGHLEMVKFLLEHGADHEHKTDEMHTALMEASMDGHVEVARLLLDHGAQVNMPADSFESPLTLAACGGHTKLASLLLERGANIEEVNDEGYTPLMEAAREGHEEMVALLLAQDADINAQTEETQETALTLACCGGFLEVARFLIEVGADIELGCSTPLMEAAQEGHGELVQFLLSKGANVHATTATGDTALTYACENGHTDVANYLLAAGADLEHESEGGRTPLMKAARAGHLCTVRYLIRRGADVNRATANNDHTVLSLACAGGHLSVVELLLAHGADPSHKLKDNSTCLIEASKGGHSGVMALVLGYPRNLLTPVEGTTTPPTPEQGEIPRVPIQALPTVVPPQEPDRHPEDVQAGLYPAAEMLDDLIEPVDPAAQDDSLYQQKIDSELSAASQIVSNFPSSLIERTTKSISRPAMKHIKTAEEQILEKQQIIAELQKVERELQQRMEIQKAQSEILAKKKAELASKSFQDGSSMDAISAAIEAVATAQEVLDVSEANNNLQDSPESPTCQIAEGAVSDLSLDMREIKLNRASPPIPEEFELPPFVEKQKVEESSQTGGREMVTNNTQTCEDYMVDHLSSLIDNQNGRGDVPLLRDSLSQLQTKKQAVPTTTPLPEVHTFLNNMDSIPHGQQIGGIPKGERPITEGQEQPDSTPPRDVQLDTNHLDGLSGMDQKEAVKLMEKLPKLEGLMTIDLPSITEDDLDVWKESQTAEQKRSIPQTQSVGTQCGGLDRLPLTTSMSPTPYASAPASPGEFDPSAFNPHPPVEIDAQTESNHDTALTIACAGGYDELVQMLLDKKANIEHRDKKGFTPLILAATAGHYKTVKILLQHDADIEAQSERTKDTPLSLACSGGRYEVVELLLKHGANKEHRNVSDYTPLSLAASGGYVNIIKLLLKSGAEINSRTGSKLGISPLMLAAMNGHTAAVKLLLDNGSDINAQIETNRNTALTLACFQGRTEVVSLLVDRKANVEHRAKTGLTPLMEAASGGYAEVGAVLINKGADVNAPPVPSSRDTALTIAADKGHYKFVELLLQHGAAVDVKNKKGQSSLWLACNGGHLDVVQLLVGELADIDSQDNRKVSCLMAAFRKGHVKVVRWMVKHVNQFPSDAECIRYIATVSDKELRKKCNSCLEIIVIAKNRQAAEAAKNASILLEELESEKSREENRKAAAAKRREKKRKKRKEKQAKTIVSEALLDGDDEGEEDSPPSSTAESLEEQVPLEPPSATTMTTIGIVRTTDTIRSVMNGAKKTKLQSIVTTSTSTIMTSVQSRVAPIIIDIKPSALSRLENGLPEDMEEERRNEKREKMRERKAEGRKKGNKKESDNRIEDAVRNSKAKKKKVVKDGKQLNHSLRDDYHGVTPIWNDPKKSPASGSDSTASTNLKNSPITAASPKRGQRREEGWKEVVRRSKKVTIPATSVSRVIGRGGVNINSIREMTGAHIDVERQNKGGERSINIKGSAEATRQAHQLITALIKEPDKEIMELMARMKKNNAAISQSSNPTISTQGVNGSLSSSQSSTKAAPIGTANVGGIRTVNHKNGGGGMQQFQNPNIISKPPPSQATISQFLPRNFAAMSNSQPRLSSVGGNGPTQLQPQLPPRLAGGNLRWGAPQVRPLHAPPSLITRAEVAPSPAVAPPLQTSMGNQVQAVKNIPVQVSTGYQQQPPPSQEKVTPSKRRLFPPSPVPAQSSSAPGGSPLKQMVSPPISSSGQMVDQVFQNSHSSSLFSNATITVTANMERHDNQMTMHNPSGLVFTSAPIGMPKQVTTDSNQSFAPIPNPQIGLTGNARLASNMNLINQLSQSVGADMRWLTGPQHGLESENDNQQQGSLPLQTEEAKAPGYKRLSAPPGNISQMPPSMTSNTLSRAHSYSGQGPIFNQIQNQYYSNAMHSIPSNDRTSMNPSPFSHAPPPDITSYSPVPTPESHTPTPPPNGSPVSPGASPRSGSTSPSSQERKMPRPIGTERHKQQQHRKPPLGYPSVGPMGAELMGPLSGTAGSSIWAFQAMDGNQGSASWLNSSGLETLGKNSPHMVHGMQTSLPVSDRPMFTGHMNMVPGLNPYNPSELQEPMHGGLPPPHQMAYQPGAGPLPLDSRLWNPAHLQPSTGSNEPPREWVAWSQQTM